MVLGTDVSRCSYTVDYSFKRISDGVELFIWLYYTCGVLVHTRLIYTFDISFPLKRTVISHRTFSINDDYFKKHCISYMDVI